MCYTDGNGIETMKAGWMTESGGGDWDWIACKIEMPKIAYYKTLIYLAS